MWKIIVSTIFLANQICASAADATLSLSTEDILNRSLNALGGQQKLQALQGISYHHYLYRTYSVEEGKLPGIASEALVASGTETISYNFSENSLNVVQRIDRHFTLGSFWNWARPQLEPSDTSIVVRGGAHGYSCYVKGNEHIGLSANTTFGYNDGYLTNVLVRDAERLSPLLLLQMWDRRQKLSQSSLLYRGAGPYPTLFDKSTNLTVGFDPKTYLPYFVRTYDDHWILGKSTNDFQLYNYTDIQGMMVPQSVQIVYNEDNILLHVLRGNITLNPEFPSKFFDGVPLEEVNKTSSGQNPSTAAISSEYGAAEVFENNQNFLWYGPSKPSFDTLTATQPIPNLPNLYHLAFAGSTYTHTIGVFDDAVFVTDAPPHQSKVVIEWVKKVLRRKVTHLLISHHHHDHSYGAIDFVNAGAKLVVPRDFKYFWKNIPGAKFVEVTEDRPFAHTDSNMQMRAIWHRDSVHCSDWMYFTWTETCPNSGSALVATIADVWSPGVAGYMFDQPQAVNYLALTRKDHMPYNYTVFPAHGVPTPITALYNATGYVYPKYSIQDFIGHGSHHCKTTL